MADFDRTIPPGGEGKITLKVALKGFQGNVKKAATVFTNDPEKSRIALTMQGTVKALVEVRPTNMVTFRGAAAQLSETTIDLVGTIQPFHVTNVETNLTEKIEYQLETVEDGKHYRLKISNRYKQGNYGGFIKCMTDLAQKPEILIRVVGYIEGDLAVKPQTLLVGKMVAQQSIRLGKVLLLSNRGKPFKITSLVFDAELISVTQAPLPKEPGFSLEITPKLENIPEGSRQQTAVMIETDMSPTDKYEVQVHVINAAAPAAPTGGDRPLPGDTDREADQEAEGTEKQ